MHKILFSHQNYGDWPANFYTEIDLTILLVFCVLTIMMILMIFYFYIFKSFQGEQM